ncbi:MAG TPA: hypothetical protein ENO16_01915 [Chromatiales bacterium]|nr:hypothetical protein [Chromatiales bacterium]
MRTYSDNEIDFWGEVFTACRLYAEGVRFDEFIEAPEACLRRYGMDDAIEIMARGFLPLLPRQARVRQRHERLMPICESVNGVVIPLMPVHRREDATGLGLAVA